MIMTNQTPSLDGSKTIPYQMSYDAPGRLSMPILSMEDTSPIEGLKIDSAMLLDLVTWKDGTPYPSRTDMEKLLGRLQGLIQQSEGGGNICNLMDSPPSCYTAQTGGS